MKIVFGLIILLIFSKDCNQKHLQASNFDNEKMTISYEASTRGFYEKTWITKDSVYFSYDRSLKKVTVSKCEGSDWDYLVSLVKEINVEKLSELEAPSKKYQVDGAAMSTLTINLNNESYQTKIFDRGNPPKVISELVNKVLSIKEVMLRH